MEPIAVLLLISGGSIVTLFCLFSAITIYWYVTDDTQSPHQRKPWAADRGTAEEDAHSAERQRRR